MNEPVDPNRNFEITRTVNVATSEDGKLVTFFDQYTNSADLTLIKVDTTDSVYITLKGDVKWTFPNHELQSIYKVDDPECLFTHVANIVKPDGEHSIVLLDLREKMDKDKRKIGLYTYKELEDDDYNFDLFPKTGVEIEGINSRRCLNANMVINSLNLDPDNPQESAHYFAKYLIQMFALEARSTDAYCLVTDTDLVSSSEELAFMGYTLYPSINPKNPSSVKGFYFDPFSNTNR